ncbi:MAG: orotidine-5'-phosphate decarboxylase [Acidipila sp.]|nr:orotidine-5'-phosphate decarboxylase [Acidipila sp.]
MATEARSRLIVALDFASLAPADAMARKLAGKVGLFKVGKQLFTAEGPPALAQISSHGVGIFLDLKYHDIPNTVAGAVAAALGLPGVGMLNVHSLGGSAMMRAAARASAEAQAGRSNRAILLAVTLLTSHDAGVLRELGLTGTPQTRAVKLARLARRAGLDGVVASPREIRAIRAACGKKFRIAVPGVRPAGAAMNDQERVATPEEAMRAGADYLIVGRPIIEARDPVAAAEAIIEEMRRGLARRV